MTTAAFHPALVLPRTRTRAQSQSRQSGPSRSTLRMALPALVFTAAVFANLPMARGGIESFGQTAGSLLGSAMIDQSEAVQGAAQRFAP